MLITDKKKLIQYNSNFRIWQGIPSIERTQKGRLFAAFYSGGTTEEYGNYCVILKSDDDGQSWSEPIAAAYKSEFYRCFDPCLWIDPLDRLWFTWSISPNNALYGVICENPDSDDLEWGEEFEIGNDVMMNKPIVLSTGEWMFPIAVWENNIKGIRPPYPQKNKESGAFLYKTIDNGKTFSRLGTPFIPSRSFDEHMAVELSNGVIMMLTRTSYGISSSYSYDGGHTWTVAQNSNIPGPDSRFHIRRLASGRILLINHVNFNGRNNLAALLSDDEGITWSKGLLIDERDNVSYPDAVESDGFIYIIYDRERGAYKSNYDEAKAEAREILMAKITEEDILNGKLVNNESRLKCIVSKLDHYDGNPDLMYKTPINGYTSAELREFLLEHPDNDTVMNYLFNTFGFFFFFMTPPQIKALDRAISNFKERPEECEKYFKQIIKLLTNTKIKEKREPAVDFVINYIDTHFSEPFEISDIIKRSGFGRYYLSHLFKSKTGITMMEYRNHKRISHAKKLLSETDKNIADIAHECGFDDANYFVKVFKQLESITPSRYRELKLQ